MNRTHTTAVGSTLREVRERLVDRTLLLIAFLMPVGALLSWSRAAVIGVRPVMYLHAFLAGLYIFAALLRRRLSMNAKAFTLLLSWFAMGVAGLAAFGLVGMGSHLLIILVLVAAAFLGNRQGWLTLAAVVVVVAIASLLLITAA